MDKLRPGIDVSEQEAGRISSEVMEGLRAIEAENCVIHDDIHTRNVVLREGACLPLSSTLEWHTSGSLELVMNGGTGLSMEVQTPDTCKGFLWIPRAGIGNGLSLCVRCQNIEIRWHSTTMWKVCPRLLLGDIRQSVGYRLGRGKRKGVPMAYQAWGSL